jgi:sugar phosphate isomerase/epimerase
MRFAICNEVFDGWTPRRIIEHAATLGYDGIEWAPYTLSDHADCFTPAQRRELRLMSADAGIAVVGLHWLFVKPPGLALCSPDAALRARTTDYLRRLVDLCGDLGGKIMVFGSPKQRQIPASVAPTIATGWAAETFATCAEAAAAREVTLCLEALPADLTNFLNTNAEVRALVDQVAHPRVRMMVDVKSMSAEAMSIADNIRACRGRFDHVHANDANLKGPGFGETDYRPIAAALREVDFNGYVSVEVFDYTEGSEVIAARSLDYLRRSFATRA